MFSSLFILVLATAPSDETLHQRLDALAERTVKEAQLASASVAVMRGDRLIHEKAYGLADVESRLAASPEHRYYVGSIGKEFVAASIERLIERKRIELDARVSRYLPDAPEPVAKVTVRQLLSHTSGIPDITNWEGKGAFLSTQTCGRSGQRAPYCDAPLQFEPGSRWAYSNSNFLLLVEILEKVTGGTYESFLFREVLPAAGLSRVSICDDRIVPMRASGYTRVRARLENAPRVPRGDLEARLCMPALELVRWQRALAAGKVVKPETYQRMSTPVRTSDGARNGYGEGLMLGELAGHAWVGHGGNGQGFAAMVAHFPSDE